MAVLYGHARCLTAENDGFRPGQIVSYLRPSRGALRRGVLRAWRDSSRSARGAPSVGSLHQIACNFNGARVGILRKRQAKEAGRPPCPLGWQPWCAPAFFSSCFFAWQGRFE
jgi:hypothetical protein